MSGNQQVSRRGPQSAADTTKQRALADAVGAEQTKPFAGRNSQAHAAQHFALAVLRVNVANVQNCSTHALAPARICHNAASAAKVANDRASLIVGERPR